MRTSSAKTLETGMTLTYLEPMQEAFRIKFAWIVAIAASGT
jgi:hypothetical protein